MSYFSTVPRDILYSIILYADPEDIDTYLSLPQFDTVYFRSYIVEKYGKDFNSMYQLLKASNLEWIHQDMFKLMVNNIDILPDSHRYLAKIKKFYGIEINARDLDGYTPLIHAIEVGDITICKFLIFNGVDVNYYNSGNYTPLMYATTEEDIDIVSLLLKYHADVNVVNVNEDTALSIALRWPHMQIAELLLNNGANANRTDSLGNSLLLQYVHIAEQECVRLLLKYGANIRHRNKEGVDALLLATENQFYPSLITILYELLPII